jgi:predicted phage tail protein
MAKILIKRVGFWAGLAKLGGGMVLILSGHVEAGIAVIIGGVSSMIHSGETTPPAAADNGTK